MLTSTKLAPVSLPLAMLILIQSLLVRPLYALSGGPIQPEFSQAATISANGLVDPFTGNFRYSIPLMEIGSLPLELSYASDSKMEDEASWVGLGWSLNPGAITRQVRGIPDDFNGDKILRQGSIRKSVTTSITPGQDVELFGAFGLSSSLTFNYNNYTGFSFSRNLSPSLNPMGAVQAIKDIGSQTPSTNETNPEQRDDTKKRKIKPYAELAQEIKFKSSISASINSRSGLDYLSFGASQGPFRIAQYGIQFGGFSYTPVADFPRQTNAKSWNFKVGSKPGLPFAANITLQGQRLEQEYAASIISQNAYGYMYLEGARKDPRSIMDYNVEKSGLLMQQAPRLPMPFGTPDGFFVSGGGMAGQIEIKRNDVGMFRPPLTESNSRMQGTGGDVALGADFHVGANYNYTKITSRRNGWSSLASTLGPDFGFASNDGLRETVHMRFTGEMNVGLGEQRYAALGSDLPLYVPIHKPSVSRTVTLADEIWTGLDRDEARHSRGDRTNITDPFKSVLLSDAISQQRRFRKHVVSYLDAQTAAFAAFERPITTYEPATTETGAKPSKLVPKSIRRTDGERLAHHLSEIRITADGGHRYIYGLPAYNLLKKEVTFSASAVAIKDASRLDQGSQNYGTVSYTAQDVSPRNKNGHDHFFDGVTTPAYVTANLLTAILSPDYVDRTGNGPTPDDLGNYTHVGYTHAQKAGWRSPAIAGRASYYEGNQADPGDDKGSYTYGEKEVYYVHHIDSKTHRAIFYTSDRVDALPVTENGNHNSSQARLQKLDSIRLFSFAELNKYKEEALPLKTVHLTYYSGDQSISGNLPNALTMPSSSIRSGKLTLRSVALTYRDNYRGLENPYLFNYQADNNDINYQANMVDRWGNQRPAVPGYPGPQRFPYAIQGEAKIEPYCAIGNLSEITLPSGGKLSVIYEPDDYAYVQEKRSARMFKLAGIESGSASATGKLYDGRIPHTNLLVDVDKVVLNEDNSINTQKTKELYFEDVKQLFFDVKMYLKSNLGGSTSERYANRVKGFATFHANRITVAESGSGYRLTIPLKSVDRSGQAQSDPKGNFHPFTYAGLSLIDAQIPNLIYNMRNRGGEGIEASEMLDILQNSGGVFRNYFNAGRKRMDCRIIDIDESFVRLAEPTYAKWGDGTRVQKISVDDRWLKGQIDDANHQYTQLYDYTTSGPHAKRISSGVAANEPMIGSQANLNVNTEDVSQDRALAPDALQRIEGPVGFQFYPGPTVGYSEVTITTELPEAYQQSRPGKTVYEFYTAKDFPVIGRTTAVSSKRVRPLPNIGMFVSVVENKLGLSQGYSIEVNDMHGKQKAVKEYNAISSTPISSSVYRYKETLPRGGRRVVSSEVEVSFGKAYDKLLNGGSGNDYTTDEQLGLEADLWIQTEQEVTTSEGIGGQFNVDFQTIAIVPSLYPNFSTGFTQLQSAVFTKLIKRYGILEEVEVTKNGSTLSSNNLRWDALTGNPVLSSTENEFGQPIYSHTLPAYYLLEHQEMGPGYLNEGINLQGVSFREGSPYGGNYSYHKIFSAGDELALVDSDIATTAGQVIRAFVIKTEDGLRVIDDNGDYIDFSSGIGSVNVIIVRSGRRNQLSAAGGNTNSLTAPNEGNYWKEDPTQNRVLESSAIVYTNEWSANCRSAGSGSDEGDGESGCTPAVSRRFGDIQAVLSDNSERIAFDLTADKDDFINCGLCEELFHDLLYARAIRNVGDYYDSHCPAQFEVSNSDSVDMCAFLDTQSHPWLMGRGTGLQPFNPDNAEGDQSFRYSPIYRCLYPDEYNDQNEQHSRVSARGVSSNISSVEQESCYVWSLGNPNPYLNGNISVWRPFQTYTANKQGRQRTYQQADQNQQDELDNNYGQPLIYQDGVLTNYVPFWQDGVRVNGGQSHQLVNQVNSYSKHGQPLETEDALGIHSSVQFGFEQLIPVASAANAERKDFGFESFEDYQFWAGSSGATFRRHFSAAPGEPSTRISTNTSIDHDVAHTGYSSLQLASRKNSKGNLVLEYTTAECAEITDKCDLLTPCNCIESFAPEPGSRYQASFWVARNESLSSGDQIVSPGYTPSNRKLNQTFFFRIYESNGSNENQIGLGYPEGPIIDGWQRVLVDFDLSDEAEKVKFEINTPSTVVVDTDFYVDDFRVYPFASSMTSSVYDPYTLRLMAQLDDNNYAVLYEYDDEGQLIRQKRETERGVRTITEQHSNTRPMQMRQFSFEAECAEFGDALVIKDKSSYSNGQYLVMPGEVPNQSPGSNPHRITFSVENAVAGTYFLSARMLGRGPSRNSFYVRINGGTWYTWHVPSNGLNWHQYKPGSVRLNDGQNVIEFAAREAGTYLDKIYVSTNPGLPRGEGHIATNCPSNDNHSPIAKASYTLRMNGDTPVVILNGSESSDSEGPISTYIWSINGQNIGAGEIFNYPGLTPGDHTVTLKVMDSDDAINQSSIVVTVPEPPVSSFALEAECAEVGGGFVTESHPTAANGSVVYWNGASSHREAPANLPENRVRFSVDLDVATSYRVYARCRGDGSNANSFYVRINNGEWKLWHYPTTNPSANGLVWSTLDDETIPFRAGANTIDFAYREAGTYLDKLYLTQDSVVPDGDGGEASNCNYDGGSTPPAATAIAFEAECNVGGSGFITKAHPTASNGSVVYWSGASSHHEPPADVSSNRVRFVLELDEPVSYRMYARCRGDGSSANSFYVRINGGEWKLFFYSTPTPSPEGLVWSSVGDLPIQFNGGINLIDFAHREAGTYLDKIQLEPGNHIPTSTGLPTSNCE